MENFQQQNYQPQAKALSLPGVGSLLKRTWQIYKERFSTFIAISVVSLVMIIPMLISKLHSPIMIPSVAVLSLATLFFVFWSTVALIYSVKNRDQKIGFKESFSKGLPKIWPYFWTGILVVLITFGGFLLLIIPGIIFGVWFMFYKYTVVAEDLKGKKALSRSKQLVKGNFWAVVWRNLAIGVITAVVVLILSAIFKPFGKNISDIITPIFSIFLSPFVTTYSFLIYEDLKKIKG